MVEFWQNDRANIVSIVLFIAFFYPVVVGMLFKMKSRNMIEIIRSILTSIAFLISAMLTTFIVKDVIAQDKFGIMAMIDDKLNFSIDSIVSQSKLSVGICFIVVMIIIYGVFKGFIGILDRSVLIPVSREIDFKLKNSRKSTRVLLGGVLQLPRSVCYVLIVSVLLTLAGIFMPSESLNRALSESSVYTFIESTVIQPVMNSDMAKKLPNIIENSFIVEEDGEQSVSSSEDGYIRGFVLYNGVTLENGVRSNEDIDAAAKSIAYSYDSTYDKAKALYKWVGSNIKYDNDKATEVMSSDFSNNISSGAISAYNTRSGVCFDYACLYAAMCRANGIGVRLIVGEGFNGASWVSHSWNEVYIPEEDRWAKVDTTFHVAGNYFDNRTFDLEHRNRKIAGEWM